MHTQKETQLAEEIKQKILSQNYATKQESFLLKENLEAPTQLPIPVEEHPNDKLG